MKRIFCILIAALLLLCSCGSSIGIPENCLNTPAYCQISDVIYLDWASDLRRFSIGAPEGMSLCFDPLCTHSKEEFCAQISGACSVVTDGERLYIKEIGGRITSLNTDGSERRTLAEFSVCNGLVTDISTDGQYVYYVEGLYRNPDDHEGDSYGIAMRVPCGGGDAEAFLDVEIGAYATIFADEENYYITDNGQFTVIDRKTGARTDVPLPAPDAYGLVLHGGNVYLHAIAEYHEYKINCRFNFARKGLWKWNGTAFETVITDIDQLVWDTDGVWYTKMLPVEDFELIGSKESYDGKGQSLYDFIRTWTGELIHHNLETGEEIVYRHENVNLKIEPVGVSNGYIIAAVNDYTKLSFQYDYVNLKPEADGTVTVHEAMKAERTETE